MHVGAGPGLRRADRPGGPRRGQNGRCGPPGRPVRHPPEEVAAAVVSLRRRPSSPAPRSPSTAACLPACPRFAVDRERRRSGDRRRPPEQTDGPPGNRIQGCPTENLPADAVVPVGAVGARRSGQVAGDARLRGQGEGDDRDGQGRDAGKSVAHGCFLSESESKKRGASTAAPGGWPASTRTNSARDSQGSGSPVRTLRTNQDYLTVVLTIRSLKGLCQ